MKTFTVALINAGERLPPDVDLKVLSKKLNSLQKTFSFQVAAAIPAEVFGKPDLGGQWYFFKRLFRIIQNHRDFKHYDYMIGITHVRLTENEDSADDGNRDWFSFSDLDKVSLITLNPNITVYNPPTKDLYQFLGFCIAGELLCNVAKKYFYHDEVRYCLFDECIDRGNVAPAMEASTICSDCHRDLKASGVSDTILLDTRKILDWCRRTTGQRSPLYRSLVHPFTTLTIGAALGWVASSFFKSEEYLYILISTAAVPSIIFVSYFRKAKRGPSRT